MSIYTTEKQAREQGYTHHGKMFGAPVWLRDLDSDCPTVAAKFAPLDYWIQLGVFVVNVMSLFRDDFDYFPILVGDAL